LFCERRRQRKSYVRCNSGHSKFISTRNLVNIFKFWSADTHSKPKNLRKPLGEFTPLPNGKSKVFCKNGSNTLAQLVREHPEIMRGRREGLEVCVTYRHITVHFDHYTEPKSVMQRGREGVEEEGGLGEGILVFTQRNFWTLSNGSFNINDPIVPLVRVKGGGAGRRVERGRAWRSKFERTLMGHFFRMLRSRYVPAMVFTGKFSQYVDFALVIRERFSYTSECFNTSTKAHILFLTRLQSCSSYSLSNMPAVFCLSNLKQEAS